MGGPPVDNASIDEEGQITLGRLVGLIRDSGRFTILSFRSFNVTLMVFFVGGVGALMSMAIVGYAGGIVDSVLTLHAVAGLCTGNLRREFIS